MPLRNAQGAASGMGSRYSAATEMSKAVDGFQKLSLFEPMKRPQNRISTIVEDGHTNVQHAKPDNTTAHLKSFKSGPRALPNDNGSVAGQGNPTRATNGTGPNSSIFTNPLPTNDRNTLGPQITSSRMGRPSTAAVSRTSAYTKTSAYTSSNWREARRPAYPALEKSSALPHSAARHCTSRKLYPSQFYHPGMILRAPTHEEDFMAATSTTTATSTMTAPSTMTATSTMTVENLYRGVILSIFGEPLKPKIRHMIVVACFARHYIAVPLFTHNGCGLTNKKADEYISVRDHRDRSPDFQELSGHGSLTTSYLQDGIRLIDPKSTAHITYPISRKYDLKIVYEGELETKSINHLVTLFNMYTPKAQPMMH